MSFTTASGPQVVSANSFKKSFKKSFKAGPSLKPRASSKKLESGKVFRPGKAKAEAECQPSLSNSRSFRVSPSLRKIAAEAVAAQDSHNSPAALVGAFSFNTNCRKSLRVAKALVPSRPTTPPTNTVMTVVSGDVGDVVESCEQGLAPVTIERRPLVTPPQLESELRFQVGELLKKVGGGDNDAAAPRKVVSTLRVTKAGGAYPDLAHLRRPSDSSNPADAVNANRRPSSVQQIMQGLVGAGKEIMNTKLFTDEDESRLETPRGVAGAKNQKPPAKPSKRASVRPEDKWWLY